MVAGQLPLPAMMSSEDMDNSDSVLSLEEGRKIWLSGGRLKIVEAVYRRAFHSGDQSSAGPKLAFLLLQSGRFAEGDAILKDLGFACRLADSILKYETPESPVKLIPESEDLCFVLDDFVRDREAEVLKKVFSDIQSTYWTCHGYSVEPPSPYFSYLIPLADCDKLGMIGGLVDRIRKTLLDWKPQLKNCTYCEMWAHNRPHATGHQLHFDSDNEGQDQLRHPVVSTVVYLSSEGGPTLVTNQRTTSQQLASHGWMSFPQEHRLVAFDGRVLHGVIPGRHEVSARRVSLMLAFWKKIDSRAGETPGAARPWPKDRVWAQELGQPIESTSDEHIGTRTGVVEARYIYQDLNGKPWTRRMGMPEYDQVYQGF